MAVLAFLQVAGMFTAWAASLYVVKWLAGLGIGLCFFLLGRCRFSRELSTEFALVVAILVIGLVAQLGDSIDGRAVALTASYAMTAATAFLIGPRALRRRSVQRIVWPGMLLGVTIGAILAEYLGFQDFFNAISASSGRLRFSGAFFTPNSAGSAGLIGVILAAAAFEAKPRWRYLTPVPVFIVVMILADSRGSLLAALTFVAALPILRMARWPPQRVAITLCLAAVGLLCLGTVLAGRIDWPAAGELEPALNRISTGRWANWKEALDYLEGPLRWMFGLGMSRNFSFAYQETDFPVPVRGWNADNFFIDLLGRTGLVGLLLFVVMTGSLAMKMWRGLKLGPPRDVSQHVLGLAVLAATVVLGGTNSLIFTWSWLQAMVAWPLVAASATRPVSPPAALAPPP